MASDTTARMGRTMVRRTATTLSLLSQNTRPSARRMRKIGLAVLRSEPSRTLTSWGAVNESSNAPVSCLFRHPAEAGPQLDVPFADLGVLQGKDGLGRSRVQAQACDRLHPAPNP